MRLRGGGGVRGVHSGMAGTIGGRGGGQKGRGMTEGGHRGRDSRCPQRDGRFRGTQVRVRDISSIGTFEWKGMMTGGRKDRKRER